MEGVMESATWTWIDVVWSLVGILWLLAAFWSKPIVRRQSNLSWLFHIIIMAAGLFLLFYPSSGMGVLGARMFPEQAWIDWASLVIVIAGCSFALWARVWLGSNWSAAPAVKQDHKLIRSGPYAVVRHPVYAGFLLAALGTVLAVGEVRGLVGFGLLFFEWLRKARAEEKFMEEQFGNDYAFYRREVKQLIPFLF
jgi:protein-S-isoprenylcysteine O-methyltransferase Ste14